MPNIFRYVLLGKESERGTAVEGDIALDPTSCTLDSPQNYEIIVPGGMGRMSRRKRKGFYSSGGGIEYPVDINSIGYLMRGVLDKYQFTAAEAPATINTHEFYGGNENELTSWTYRVGKDVHEHIFAGCSTNSLTLSVSDGLASASLDIFGGPDDTDTLKSYSDFSSKLPTGYPMAFYDVSATVNSVDSSAICRSVQLAINNNLGRDSGRCIGSCYPSTFKAGDRLVEATLEMQFNDLTHQTLFWGDAGGPAADGSTPFPLVIEMAGGSNQKITFSMPNCMMTSAPQQPRGRDILYQTITVRALLEEDVALKDLSTVDTDILVTLENTGATLA